MKKKIKVVELFAGVGGFRLGLEGWKGKSASSSYKKTLNSNIEIIWSNQWEPPGTESKQFASKIYEMHWGSENHSNKDIHEIVEDKNMDNIIPNHDLLVGGFPCQDYSVATTLKNSGGIKGRKGVLWWDIYNLLRKKKKKPKYLLLENVDRLLKSPIEQRGRDFAIMLACLNTFGYAVEWRVINAGDYGMPQRRRRVFIMGYYKTSKIYKKIKNPISWIKTLGVLAKAFEIEDFKSENVLIESLGNDGFLKINKNYIENISKSFNKNSNRRPSRFENSGIMKDGIFYTIKTESVKEKKFTLGAVIDNKVNSKGNKEFYVTKKDVLNSENGWAYHKGSKSKIRIDKKTGFKYKWAEGGMSLTENLEEPSRTIITSEGGKSPSRTKHLIKVKEKNKTKYRRLTPKELERLNMFPDNFTLTYGKKDISDTKRAFLMGNALVVGVVDKIRSALVKLI